MPSKKSVTARGPLSQSYRHSFTFVWGVWRRGVGEGKSVFVVCVGGWGAHLHIDAHAIHFKLRVTGGVSDLTPLGGKGAPCEAEPEARFPRARGAKQQQPHTVLASADQRRRGGQR
jgi:hypothetical protein